MCPIITAADNINLYQGNAIVTKMVNIAKREIDQSDKKQQWVKPEIRTIALDDPLAKYFQSLTAKQHDELFQSAD